MKEETCRGKHYISTLFFRVRGARFATVRPPFPSPLLYLYHVVHRLKCFIFGIAVFVASH